MSKTKLNSRQWKLYDAIKEATEKSGWINIVDLANVDEDYHLATSDRTHHPCITIYLDVQRINSSVEIEKIIICDAKYNYKLAQTYEEGLMYIEKLKARALREFQRYWDVEKKMAADGQGKLISTKGQVIDNQSKARNFVEAFVRTQVEEQNG